MIIVVLRGGWNLVQLLVIQGLRARIILVLCECIWNSPTISLVLPAFEVTGSPGISSILGGLSPWFSPWLLPLICLWGVGRLS